MEIKYVFLAFFNTYYSCYGRFLVAMVTYFMFSIFYLYILIGHDDTVILVYYTTFYMHSFIRGTPKPLKNVEKSSKIGRFLVAIGTLFYLFYFFIFILIGLDPPVILVYYTPFYIHSLICGNQKKTSRMGKML